jgi:hypothetical protein
MRAALIALAQSLFPVLNLLGVLNLTGDEISVVMLMVTNVISTVFLIFKRGQEPGTPPPPV